MKRESFILTMCFISMVLGGWVIAGNRGYIPDYSFYLWPLMMISILLIVLVYPITTACLKLKLLLSKYQIRKNDDRAKKG